MMQCRTLFSIFLLLALNSLVAQSQLSISAGPYIVRLDYSQFFNESRHGAEVGFMVNDRIDKQYFSFGPYTRYQFDAAYHYRFLKFEKSSFALGLGYRTPENSSDMYIEYGMLSIPLTYQYIFENQQVGIRLRLTSLISYKFEAIPMVGINFKL